MMQPRGWITSHTLQLALNRRFAHGLQFGINDTVMLNRKADAGARIQHAADGTWAYRADQAQADELFQTTSPPGTPSKAFRVVNPGAE